MSPRADIAYQALRRAIIEQALAPGSKLREQDLGKHFGMSRTLVRATLARLQTEGLVESRPRRSAVVGRPTLKDAKEVFAVRRVLEGEAVRLVVAKWRPEFGAELEGHIREEEIAKDAGDERVSIRLAGEFHIVLAALSDNALLLRYLAEVVSRCSLILALYGRPHSSECAINEHREIIDALRRRDESAATALMDRHIGSVERRALLADAANSERDLGAILSSYTSAVAPRRGRLDFRDARRSSRR